MSDRTVSVAEAATIAGCSPAVIRRRIESGELDAFADGGAWRVLTDGLSANTPDGRGHSTTRLSGPVASGLADRLMGRPWLLSPDDIAAVIGWPEDQVRYYLRRGYLCMRHRGTSWSCAAGSIRRPTTRKDNRMHTMAERRANSFRDRRTPWKAPAWLAILSVMAALTGCGSDGAASELKVSSDGTETFQTIDELASISHVVAIFKIGEPADLVPLGQIVEDGDQYVTGLQLYNAEVVDVIFNLADYYPIRVGQSMTVGVNVDLVDGKAAVGGKVSTAALTPGAVVLGFMASLETVGNAGSLGFVRSALGQFVIDTAETISDTSALRYVPGTELAGAPATLGELRQALSDGRLTVGSVILEMVGDGRLVPSIGDGETPVTTEYVQPDEDTKVTIGAQD